jgi:hypothetical protein
VRFAEGANVCWLHHVSSCPVCMQARIIGFRLNLFRSVSKDYPLNLFRFKFDNLIPSYMKISIYFYVDNISENFE